jgi:hypothetical protein
LTEATSHLEIKKAPVVRGLKTVLIIGAIASVLNAVAYLSGAIVYGLWTFDVVGPADPVYLATETSDQSWLRYFAFLRDEAPYDNAQALLACIGFAALVPIGVVLRLRLEAFSAVASIASTALIAGGLLLTAGELIHIGAWSAVTNLSTVDEADLSALSAAFEVALETGAWVMTGGWLSAGLALLVLATVARPAGLSQLVQMLSWAGGVAYVLIGLSEALDLGTFYDVAVVAGGVILGPAWALSLARSLKSTADQPELAASR